MPKISLDNLERYDGHLKDWCDARFASKSVNENWSETEEAGAVAFYPVSDTEIHPVVKFSFKETLPASGDKSPSNPSTINGVSSFNLVLCDSVGINETTYNYSLGNTYYGGEVDLATGIMTVTWAKTDINGSMSYSSNLGLSEKQDAYMLSFYPPLTRKQNQNPNGVGCNLLPVAWNSGNENRLVFSTNSNNIGICLLKSLLGLSDNLTYNDVKTAFSSFFSEHPMTIVYELATPYTVQLSPLQIKSLTQSNLYTPRLNTVYTDADTVKVRYQKSPIVTSSDIDNAILSLGGD